MAAKTYRISAYVELSLIIVLVMLIGLNVQRQSLGASVVLYAVAGFMVWLMFHLSSPTLPEAARLPAQIKPLNPLVTIILIFACVYLYSPTLHDETFLAVSLIALSIDLFRWLLKMSLLKSSQF